MPKRAADDSEASATIKKKAKQDTQASDSSADGQLGRDSEGNYYLDLGSLKRATVNSFKGKAQINIREYYTDKASGDVKPGKKGVTLNPSQWATLSTAIPQLTEKLASVQAEDVEESKESKKAAAEKLTKARKKKVPKKKKQKKGSEDDDEEASDNE